MKKIKLEKGITLIALIITIVVLLILAATAIAAIQDNDIIKYAKDASNEHIIGQEKEQIQLAVTEWKLQNKMSETPENFKAFMTKKLAGSTNVSGTTSGPLDIVYNETGNKYKVYSDKELIFVEEKLDLLKDYFLGKIDETTGQRSGKFLSDVVVDMKVQDFHEVKFKDNEIIGDANSFMSLIGGVYDEQSGNVIYYVEYKLVVYLVTVNPNDYSIVDVATKYEEQTKEYTLGIISEENKTINGETYSSTNPIIPAGFLAKNTATSKWDAEGGPEVDKGLVITDGSSDFVWVPVTTELKPYNLGTSDYREPDVITGVEPSDSVDSASGKTYDARNLDLVGCTDLNNDGNIDAYDFKKQLENEFDLMATSVNKYGGFYVGRYETSVGSNNKAQSIGSIVGGTNEELIIPANAGNESMKSWYGLYTLNKTYSSNSVQGSMIWGSQYNAIMTWIGDAANRTIGENRNQTAYTGGNNTDTINNIHDLYGCLFEWTIEAHRKNERTAVGGFATINEKPNAKMPLSPYQQDNWGAIISSRMSLYIKE